MFVKLYTLLEGLHVYICKLNLYNSILNSLAVTA